VGAGGTFDRRGDRAAALDPGYGGESARDPGRELASLASWADDYRALHLDTARRPFVDIPLAAQDYDEARDSAPSLEGDCVIHELARNLRDLTDPDPSTAQRREALKFVVHFVGDVNQPLHTVAELHGYKLN
jgi:nuclease S1